MRTGCYHVPMNVTPELIAIVAVGVASLAFLWRLSRDMARLERDLRQDMRGLERDMQGMGERFSRELRGMDERFSRELREVEERFSRELREMGERVSRDIQGMSERFSRDMQGMNAPVTICASWENGWLGSKASSRRTTPCCAFW